MPDLSQFKTVISAVPDTVAQIRAGVAARAAAVASHDDAVAAEADRHAKATQDEADLSTANLQKISDDFAAAVADLPADPVAAEGEVQDFLAQLESVITTVRSANPAAIA